MPDQYSDPFLKSPTGPNAAWEGHPRNNYHPPTMPVDPRDANNRRDEAARIAGQAPGTYGQAPLTENSRAVGQQRVQQLVPEVPRTPELKMSKYPDMKPLGFWGSAADRFVRTPNFTQSAIEMTDPSMTQDRYNTMHGENPTLRPDRWAMEHLTEEQRRKMYRPPEGWAEKTGGWLGQTGKKILDPVSIAAAIASGGLPSVAATGAALEGGESMMQQHMGTGRINPWQVGGEALIGGLSAMAGDKVIPSLGIPGGALGELVGRASIGGLTENAVKDLTKSGYATANEKYQDALARR